MTSNGTFCAVTTLTKNKITKLKYWSTFDEIIRYLKGKDASHKANILLEEERHGFTSYVMYLIIFDHLANLCHMGSDYSPFVQIKGF